MYDKSFNTKDENLGSEGGISEELGFTEQTSCLSFLECPRKS